MDIHFNAGSPAASGTECFIANDASAHSKEMAKEICNTASSVMGIKNRGVKTEGQSQHNKIGILHQGAGTAVLWEICFISNQDDMVKYDQNRGKLAKEIAKICKKYDDLI